MGAPADVGAKAIPTGFHSCGEARTTRGCPGRVELLRQLSSFERLRPFIEASPDLRFLVLSPHGRRRYALVGRGLDVRFDEVDDALLEQVRRATSPGRPMSVRPVPAR